MGARAVVVAWWMRPTLAVPAREMRTHGEKRKLKPIETIIRASRVAIKILSRNCRSCSLRSFNIRSVDSKRLFIEASSVFKDIFSFLSVEEDGSGPDGIKQNDPDKSSPWRKRERVR